MILETLRSTLIVGTVLINAVQLGQSVERLDVTPLETTPTAPLVREVSPVATTSLMTPVPSLPIHRASLFTARHVEAGLAKWKRVSSGLATWYGLVLNQHRTASGERFDCTQLTAASNTLPFGTRVKVTNLKNGLSVIVRVNDRGLLDPGHVIDITSAAAQRIGLLRMGIAPVHLDVLAKAG